MPSEPNDDEDGGDTDPFLHSCRSYSIFGYSTAFVLNILMVITGVLYSESCRIEIVPQFLQISGGIMLSFTILYGLCTYCCERGDGSINFALAFIIG